MKIKVFLICLFFVKNTYGTEDWPHLRKKVTFGCDPTHERFVTYNQHPYNCAKFIMCHGIRAIIMECPKGLIFDNELKTCNYRNDVDCVQLKYPESAVFMYRNFYAPSMVYFG